MVMQSWNARGQWNFLAVIHSETDRILDCEYIPPPATNQQPNHYPVSSVGPASSFVRCTTICECIVYSSRLNGCWLRNSIFDAAADPPKTFESMAQKKATDSRLMD